MEVVREGYPDHTAFDVGSNYFDPKSDPENPRWFMVDIKYIRHTRRVIPLSGLKTYAELENMPLVRRGNRLSIMPVSASEWKFIISLEAELDR